MNELPDRDQDGIPDVIEDTLDEARAIKRRFGTKQILVVMFVGLIVAGYGLGAFFYLDMKDDYIALQQQYDWQQTEHEIEINAALIAERTKKLAALKEEAVDLQADIDKIKAERKDAEHAIKAKPYARRNEHEANNLNTDELIRGFGDLGFPAKSGNCE